MNLINSALCVALNTGDYNETLHAIGVLNDNAGTNGGGIESYIEVAARILGERFEKNEAFCSALMRQNDFLAKANKDMEEKHQLDEKLIEHRTEEVRWLECKNKRLRDALAEIEASSVGWKEEVARAALEMRKEKQ